MHNYFKNIEIHDSSFRYLSLSFVCTVHIQNKKKSNCIHYVYYIFTWSHSFHVFTFILFLLCSLIDARNTSSLIHSNISKIFFSTLHTNFLEFKRFVNMICLLLAIIRFFDCFVVIGESIFSHMVIIAATAMTLIKLKKNIICLISQQNSRTIKLFIHIV